jgi:NADH dehydrogenase
MSAREGTPRVVIVGAGFGGLTAAQALRRDDVHVTVVDRTNHHLFQPLLYQVATAGLSATDIATPIRSVLAAQKNTSVLLADVTGVDLVARKVELEGGSLPYDFLILAAGAHTNYFGHPEWETYAPGLKSLDDALEIRHRVLLAFEQAEREPDPEAHKALLTFVVIGAGPTGVELAGALAELSRRVLARDFRSIDPRSTRVLLVEAGPKVLPTFADSLPEKAAAQLRELGVEVRTDARVSRIDERGISLGEEFIATSTMVWTAGVRTSPLAARLGVALHASGRVLVAEDLSIPGHPEAFVIGDMAYLVQEGVPLPGLSPVAMQQARAVARSIARTRSGRPREAFRYFDKGTMATIGRSRAGAQTKRLRMSGLVAWLAWLFVHIWYLIGFHNRFVVMFNWIWSYWTYKRGARVITGLKWRADTTPRAALAAPRDAGATDAQPRASAHHEHHDSRPHGTPPRDAADSVAPIGSATSRA